MNLNYSSSAFDELDLKCYPYGKKRCLSEVTYDAPDQPFHKVKKWIGIYFAIQQLNDTRFARKGQRY